jgi:adenylate cyclase
VLVYELLGLKGETDRATEELADLHGQALARYCERDWGGALALFEKVLGQRPGDRPAQQMLLRCRQFLAEPPGEAWSAIQQMDSK